MQSKGIHTRLVLNEAQNQNVRPTLTLNPVLK